MAYGDIQNLSPHQRHVIRSIIAIGRRRGRKRGMKPREIRKMINTALAVGYTESRYQNLPGGDRDSQGWRQERRMYYKNPRNLKASINRFYDEYFADANKSAPLGVRAQQVQQSGTPHVWDTLAPLANRIRKQFSDAAGMDPNGAPLRRGRGTKLLRAPSGTPPQTKTDYSAAILDRLLGDKKGSILDTIMEARTDPRYTTTIPGTVTPGKVKKYGVPRTGPGDVAKLAGGKGVQLQVRKDGWKGSKSVADPFAAIAKKHGLVVSSTKRPTVNTTSGNMSDHYQGNKSAWAYDLSGSVAQMDKAAKAMAKALGLKSWQGVQNITKKINGRTYRIQFLYRTNVGGNHYNHIHLGVRRID